MADQEAAPAANQRFYKLPDFWSASPAAWFGVVEAQFLLRGPEAQRDRFALVSAVLPEASARRVAHILAAPGDTCYTDLKAALLAAHQLTSVQKAERLFSAEALGECRPSELLSEMLELVHPGEERTRLFSMLFLRRLPPAVRLQLTRMYGTLRRRLTAVPPQFIATSRQLPQSSLPQPTTHRRWRSRRISW